MAGGAAARLTPETRAGFLIIPFPRIVGMRNRVVHDYGSVDFGDRLGNNTGPLAFVVYGASAVLCRAR